MSDPLINALTLLAGALEVHADPEEIQYWKEVEQEKLLTDSGDSSSGDEEEQQ